MYFPSSGLTKGYRSRGNLFVSDLAPSRRLKRPRKKRLVYPAPYAIIFPSAVVLQLYVCSVNLLPREFFAPANIFELFTTGWRQQWRKKKKRNFQRASNFPTNSSIYRIMYSMRRRQRMAGNFDQISSITRTNSSRTHRDTFPIDSISKTRRFSIRANF